MLLDVKKYLAQKKSVNLQEMALHFRQSPDNMRCLLQHWVRKGKVCCMAKPMGCGTRCQMCKPENAEVYQWLGG